MVQYDVKRVTKGTENSMVSFDFAKTPITQVADYIIIAASKNKSSDIHFDPREDGMMVRFRIDGDCQDYTFIPKAYERNLTTRLKLLANMNITETRLPQDGAIKGQFGDTYLDMRVACLPTNQGEKIVIRILDYTRSLQGIDSLGFHPKNLEKIHHMMSVPNGIILVTGATGSGKSTTTYSMLSALNKPEINVITVEDPVEMNIEGINQVQVNSEIGMTFAAALRSILREDPNVILIGEIRDSETAQIAVRASITGHLVMSTLHTNNALATVERLLDMDVERYLLSTALTGIISQRLAKQLCPDCRLQREPTKYEKEVYKKFLHQDINLVWDANPKGCDNCRKGYKGRLAVHEVLLLDDKIRNALNDEKMSKEDFAKMIYSGNTISMLQDALIKVLEGKTSFEEVYKTIEIENEDEGNYTKELEGVIINQPAAEKAEEIKSEEDFIEEKLHQDSNLTEEYAIPGLVSIDQQQTEKTPETKDIDNELESDFTTNIEEQTTNNTLDSNNTKNYESIILEIPYANSTSAEENNNQELYNETDSKSIYAPDQAAKEESQENNIGYVVAMPHEHQDDNHSPTEEEKIQALGNVTTEEHTASEFETLQVNGEKKIEQKENEHTPEEQNTFQKSILYLDNTTEEVHDKNNTNTEADKEKNKGYATQDDIAPIVNSEEETEAENEKQENNSYQNTNTIYYEEEAIEPTIDIRTDLDELIIPDSKIERLDINDKEIIVSEKLDDSPEKQSPAEEKTEKTEKTIEEQPIEKDKKYVDSEDNYEYDNYDFDNFDNKKHDYTEAKKDIFNQAHKTEHQESIPTTQEIPNIQAISAVPNVTDIPSVEEQHTGSKLLTDPGIRIADDGSINQSAEINAEPILPNYEDE